MGRTEKTLRQMMSGSADANIRFSDLCSLLRSLGFAERISGSHHIFRKSGVEELINIQCDGDKVKVYQVKQVRAILIRHNLGGRQ